MSLYDKASFIYSGRSGAGVGNESVGLGKAFAIKPEEVLNGENLITDPNFEDSSAWNMTNGVTISDGYAVFSGVDNDNVDLYQTYKPLKDTTFKVTFEVSDFKSGYIRPMFYNGEVTNRNIVGNGRFSQYVRLKGGHNGNIGLRAGVIGSSGFRGKVTNFSITEVIDEAVDFRITRSSDLASTRVNADGLIEKCRINLLTNSRDLTASTWTASASAIASMDSSYDGKTVGAFKVTRTAQYGAAIQNVTASGLAVGVQTLSCIVRNFSSSNLVQWFRPLIEFTDDSTAYAYFDLSGDGATGTSSGVIHTSITKLNASWFRCTMTFEGSTKEVRLHPADGDGDISGTSGGIRMQAPMLELGMAATSPIIYTDDRIETEGTLENEPRYSYGFDSSGNVESDPKLLVERQAENLITHSEYLSSNTWYKEGIASVTHNDSKSPEGYNNALLLTEDTADDNHWIYQQMNDYFELDEKYTVSFYAKNPTNGCDRVSVNIYNGVDSKFIDYSLVTGTVASADTGDVDASIENVGDGWYRIKYTRKLGTSADVGNNIPNFRICMTLNGAVTYTGTGRQLLLYGIQLEKGRTRSFDSSKYGSATSYIPNHGTAAGVTRYRDQVKTENDTARQTILAKEHFTVFVDFEDYISHGDGLFRMVLVNTGNTTTTVFLYHSSLGYPGTSTSGSEYYTSSGIIDGTQQKIIFRYDGEAMKIYVNGTLVKTDDTVTAMAGVKFLDLNYGSGQARYNQVMVFPVALSDEECEDLTEL